METRTSYTFALTPEQQILLAAQLQAGNYRPVIVPHTTISADGENCRIALFTSGKCLIQGRGAAQFVEFVMEPLVLREVKLGYETVLDPTIAEPHIGVDESGKGDFFGPLVTASAYVDHALYPQMKELNVRDSKRITSDKVALDLATSLQKILGRRYSIVSIGPARYNDLYAKMRNVNQILAWAHARAIENLLAVVPGCPRAISDQFGNKSLVERALMQRGRTIELVQRHRAESDMAVAAASIIARAAFLRALSQMANEYHLKIPKGASDGVRAVAVNLVKTRGPGILLAVAKCHFKTTDAVLQQAGHSRSELGPVGAVVSKPMTRPYHHHSSGRRTDAAGTN